MHHLWPGGHISEQCPLGGDTPSETRSDHTGTCACFRVLTPGGSSVHTAGSSRSYSVRKWWWWWCVCVCVGGVRPPGIHERFPTGRSGLFFTTCWIMKCSSAQGSGPRINWGVRGSLTAQRGKNTPHFYYTQPCLYSQTFPLSLIYFLITCWTMFPP